MHFPIVNIDMTKDSISFIYAVKKKAHLSITIAEYTERHSCTGLYILTIIVST